MEAKISINNYDDNRKNLRGTINIENGLITLEMPGGIILKGDDVNRDTNEKIILKTDSHIMELDWKSSSKLSGRWKSKGGSWKTTTITINDLKKKELESWWDREDFADLVDLSLISMFEKQTRDKDSRISKDMRVSSLELSRLKRIGPYFSPYSSTGAHLDNTMNRSLDTNIDDDLFGITKATVPFNGGISPIPIIALSSLSRQGTKEEETEYLNNMKEIRPGSEVDDIVTGILHMEFLVKQKIPNIYMKKKLPCYANYLLTVREEGGIYASKKYIHIDFKNGLVYPSISKTVNNYSNMDRLPNEVSINDVYDYTFDMLNVSWATASILDFYPQSKKLWTVKAQEDNVKSSFGVSYEQIKSLFYAADRGLTKTGRRKALRHWIRSHQKRMKEGTEVKTIPKKLRGENKFSIKGTNFEIIDPI